ncbi:hypothetical protein BE20_25630 [Sorangium cellulosum]|nr:hypothetical protein BE20_25630 [Sorangium cellulosum]
MDEHRARPLGQHLEQGVPCQGPGILVEYPDVDLALRAHQVGVERHHGDPLRGGLVERGRVAFADGRDDYPLGAFRHRPFDVLSLEFRQCL